MNHVGQRIANNDLREAFRDYVGVAANFVPVTADPNYFRVSTVLAAQTTTRLAADMTASVVPQWPVVPILVVANDHASGETAWTSLSATFRGVDQFGQTITETVAATVDGSGFGTNTWTATANSAFSSLISVAFTIVGGTAADGSDTYIIGFAKEYGLLTKIKTSADIILSNFDGAVDAGTVDALNMTYTPDGDPNGTRVFALIVKSRAYD